MADLILSFIPGGVLTAIGAAVVAALVAAWRLVRTGRSLERGEQAEAEARAKDEQLEMHRESTDAEREAASMSDDEARKEATKWSRR